MVDQLNHASDGRRLYHDPDCTPRAVHNTSSPEPWLRADAFSPPSDRATSPDTGQDFPRVQPSPRDDVFSTAEDHPAMTCAYSLPRRKCIGQALYVDPASQSRRHFFPRLEQQIEIKASSRELAAQMGYSQMHAMKRARSQARLRKQLKHHEASRHNLKRRTQEGEIARRASVSIQNELSDSLRRLAQDEVAKHTVDRVQTSRDTALDARRQPPRTFRVEHRSVTRFERPRKAARLQGGLH